MTDTDNPPDTLRDPAAIEAEIQLAQRWPLLAPFFDALEAAHRVMVHGLTKTHRDGSKREPGDWAMVAQATHRAHLLAHVMNAGRSERDADSGELEYTHTLTRCLMLTALKVMETHPTHVDDLAAFERAEADR